MRSLLITLMLLLSFNSYCEVTVNIDQAAGVEIIDTTADAKPVDATANELFSVDVEAEQAKLRSEYTSGEMVWSVAIGVLIAITFVRLCEKTYDDGNGFTESSVLVVVGVLVLTFMSFLFMYVPRFGHIHNPLWLLNFLPAVGAYVGVGGVLVSVTKREFDIMKDTGGMFLLLTGLAIFRGVAFTS